MFVKVIVFITYVKVMHIISYARILDFILKKYILKVFNTIFKINILYN